MKLKKERVESAENITKLRSVCIEDCKEAEAMDLKKFYMNKYGNYMAGRIVGTLFTEFILMFIILNTGIDQAWEGIAYAETIIYGTIWGAGGIYLAQMLINVIRDTYDLKLALEDGKVKKSVCDITFREYASGKNTKQNMIRLYMKPKGKNEPIWFFTHKSQHHKMGFISNIGNASPGTKLTVYSVDDKKHDLFIMEKNKPVGDSVDKLLKDILSDGLDNQKFKLHLLRARLVSSRKNKKK